MTKLRNKTFVKQVMYRDFEICRCCGFKAHEVHHIIPLIFGGADDPTNMIALCTECHKGAPDNKKDFYDYMMSGGKKSHLILGKAIKFAEQSCEKHKKEFNIGHWFPLIKKMIGWLREVDYVNCIENHNLKEAEKIPDIDWEGKSDIIENYNENNKYINYGCV